MPSVSDRALRNAFDPRRQPQPVDYFQIALSVTRAAFAPTVVIHWTQTGAQIQSGRQLTACGEWVTPSRIAGDPTCQGCIQQQALHDACEF